jgi:retron-type reverse transcriptase
MSDQPTSRKALYERIRNSSKDEVILEEMIRLGFWPTSKDMPQAPADDIRRKGELSRRLGELRQQQMGLQSEAKLKEEARKLRMAEARARRLENRERRLRERSERAAAWRKTKQREIGYLGEGVSAGLGQRAVDEPRLVAQGLPVLPDAASLADAMGISVPALRFLAFTRSTSKHSHYQRFTVAKKSGGTRTISAPMPRLKAAQHWILQAILSRLPLHDAAHGFRPGRSIVSNAKPHVGSDVVVNMDLENFFPTVGYRRVKGLFAKFGYSEETATILALLCTEPDSTRIELDEEVYHVAVSDRFLPQGAPTSPAITNLLCRRLDARMTGLCNALGFVYTRYADDLTFSASGESAKKVGKLLSQVEWLIPEEGFKIHPGKTRIFRSGRRQEVTGLVVNESLAVPRHRLREFRSLLFHIEKDGPDSKSWGQGDDVLASAMGFANFVCMVQPEKGAALKTQVSALIARYGGGPATASASGPETQEEPKASDPKAESSLAPEATSNVPDDTPKGDTPNVPGDTPKKKKWWKLF